MKYKITDLMDLYEDQNCPLSPTEDQSGRAVDDRPCGEDGGKLLEIKTTKHSFGWKEVASLAAVLVLLVLGGFTAGWFLGREAGQPGQTDPTGQTELTVPNQTNAPTGMEEWSEETLRSLNPILTRLAEQNVLIKEYDLDTDEALARFAIRWYLYHEPDRLLSREAEGDGFYASAGLFTINSFLDGLFGTKITEEPWNDYTIGSDEGGPIKGFRLLFSAGEENPEARFAVCEGGGRLVGTDLISVTLTVYEDLRNVAVWTDPAQLTASQAKAMAENGELRAVQKGSALLKISGDDYTVQNYEVYDATLWADEEALCKLVTPVLNALAEQGVTDLQAELDGEESLVRFARNYAKLHDDGLFVRETDEGGAWETLTLNQVNEILSELLRRTVSPAEGTNYPALRGVIASPPGTYENGVFRWSAEPVSPALTFAIAAERRGCLYTRKYARSEDDYEILVSFGFKVYYAAEDAPIRQTCGTELSKLTAAEADALAEAGELLQISEGTADFTCRDGAFTLHYFWMDSYPCEGSFDPNDRALAGSLWRTGDGELTRYLRLDENHDIRYLAGSGENWTYWAIGEWRLMKDGRLWMWITQTSAGFQYPSPLHQEAYFSWSLEGGTLTLTQLSGEGFAADAAGTVLRFSAITADDWPKTAAQEPDPTDPADSDEDLHTSPTGFDSVDPEDWTRMNTLLTIAARYGFPEMDENGDLISVEDLYLYRFAQAAALTDAAGETYTVAFEAYAADPSLWPEFLSLDPARIENVSELVSAGKIRVIGYGTAEFRRESGGLRLTGYTFTPESGVTTPESLHLRGESDPEIARLSRFLTAFAQQGIGDANAELDGDAELVRFVFRYRQANDPKSILKQADGDVPARTLTLEQVNETLTQFLGKTLTPDGEDYCILTDAADAFYCFYRDGRFRYIPPYDYDGEDALRFAKVERYDEATGVLRFRVYRVNPANWPDAETYLELLPAMTVEELEGTTGIVTKIAEGEAVLSDLSGEPRLETYAAEPVQ